MIEYRAIFSFRVGLPQLEYDYSQRNDGNAIHAAERWMIEMNTDALQYVTVWAAGDENTEPRHVATIKTERVARVTTR